MRGLIIIQLKIERLQEWLLSIYHNLTIYLWIMGFTWKVVNSHSPPNYKLGIFNVYIQGGRQPNSQKYSFTSCRL